MTRVVLPRVIRCVRLVCFTRRWSSSASSPPQQSNWNLPNGLTVLRMTMGPVVSQWILGGYYDWALVGLGVAATSDILDGFIARRWKMKTVLGSYLDPLADKVLINSTVVALSMQDLVPMTAAVIVVGRDALLISGAFAVRFRQLRSEGNFDKFFHISDEKPLTVHPSPMGRTTMVLQTALVIGGVVSGCDGMWTSVFTAPMMEGLTWATSVATILSGSQYLYFSLWKFRRVYR